MKILQEYNWPANHDQFRRVLRVLSVTSDSVITSDAVMEALAHEKKLYGEEEPDSTTSDLNTDGKTMEEIMVLAVRNALKKHNNNQTAAAA